MPDQKFESPRLRQAKNTAVANNKPPNRVSVMEKMGMGLIALTAEISLSHYWFR